MVGDGTVAVAYRVPMPIRKTRTRLSDGRELIYFDDTEPYASGVVTRELHDGRDLVPVEAASTMRFDVLTGEWVTLAAHRMNRTFLPATDECPLCPTRPGRPATEIPAGDYDVAVFENRFPSLGSAAEEVPGLVDGERLWPQRAADGRCEVVCFTGDHDRGFAQLPVSRVRTVLEALRDRTRELSALPSVAQVYCFENRGEEIGVTLSHPHGQIYAYPTLPPRCCVGPRSTESARGVRFYATSSTPSGAPVPAWWSRASTGPRTCPLRRGGPSNCMSRRTGTSPISPSSTTPNSTSSRTSTSTCSVGWTASSTASIGCRTSQGGTRLRSAQAVTWDGCTCRCSR